MRVESREVSSTIGGGSATFSNRMSSLKSLPFPKPRSKVFGSVLRQLELYASDDAITIIFEGETGTGKNWLARLTHGHSRRRDRQLHELSLAGVNDSLAASELFGHEIGSFTGAHARRKGAFQTATHGTLFLDEIGKASMEVQRRLLRAVDEQVISPVGSDRTLEVDVRLLGATNVSLKSLVSQGLFLPDLHARLGQFLIRVPPLRERREDIPDLANYFLAMHAAKLGYPAGLPTVHPSLMEALQGAKWEYNLRALSQAMHRLVIEADSAIELTFEHCRGDILEALRVHKRGRPPKSSRTGVTAAVNRSPSIADAARSLDVSRSTIYRKLAMPDTEPPLQKMVE